MARKKKPAPPPLATFDDLDAAGLGAGYRPTFTAPAEETATTEPAKRGFLGAANDTVIEIANAAAGGVKAAADFVVPGNAVSDTLGRFIEHGEQSQSDVVKAEKQKFRSEVAAANGIGDELLAVGRYVTSNPLLTAAQAAGSFALPAGAVKGAGAAATALGAGAKGAAAAGRAGGVAAGGAMAGGDAGGSAFDLVMQAPIEALLQNPMAQELAARGADEATIRQTLATAAARDASLLPAIIGAAGGAFGAERLLAGGARKAGARGLAAATASEAAQEGVEEGVTHYEGQRAAGQFVPGIDPSKGVAAAAGLGAVLGGGTGGAVQLMTSEQALPEPKGPLTRAANSAPVAAAAGIAPEPAPQEAPPPDPMVERIKKLPAGDREEALAAYNLLARDDLPKGVRQYNSRLLDSLLDKQEPAEEPSRVEPSDPAALLSNTMGRDPLQGALQERQDEQNALTNLDNWMARAKPLPLEKAQDIQAAATERGLQFEVVPHGAGQGYTVVPAAWITPQMRNQTAAALPLDTQPTGVLRADARGNVVPETGAQAIDSRNAAKAQAAERQRKNELGLTPDVEAVQRGAKRPPKPTVQAGDVLNKQGKPFTTKGAAVRAQKKAPGDLLEVDGGWVVRPQGAAAQEASNVGDATAAGAVDPGNAGQLGADGQPGGAPAAAVGADAGGDVRADAARPDGSQQDQPVPARAGEQPAAVDAQDRNGLRAEDRRLRNLSATAGELAMQFMQEAGEADFDTKELPAALEQWATDAKVSADELRPEVVKALDRFDGTKVQREKIKRALTAPKKPAAAPKEQTAPQGERWSAADAPAREKVLLAAGWKTGSPGLEKMKAQSWEKMTQGQRNRIAKAMPAPEQTATPESSTGAASEPVNESQQATPGEPNAQDTDRAGGAGADAAAPAAGDTAVREGDAETKRFYVTMIRDGRVARLAGPYDTKEEAEAQFEPARKIASEVDPFSDFDAFGVSAITAKEHKPGTLNARLAQAPQEEPSAAVPARAEGEAGKAEETPPAGADAAAAAETGAEAGAAAEVEAAGLKGKKRDAKSIVREIARARPFDAFEDLRTAAAEAVRKEAGEQELDDLNAGFLRNEMAESVHAGQYEGIRAWAAALPVPVLETQISREAAMRAHAGTSHSPDERGAGELRSYVRALAAAWRAIEAKYNAADEPTQANVRAEFEKLRDGYASRVNAYLAAHSRVMSSMIAGPARFPVESNRKKSETADRRGQEAQDWLAKGKKRLARAFAGPVDNSLSSELASIEQRIAEKEALQAKMKAANAAMRKGDDAALRTLGFDDARIAQLKKPDAIGRKGFPDYALTNNNAEIRRLKDRLVDVRKRIEGAAAQEPESDEDQTGPRIVQDAEANRVRILFDGKPDEATRATLKKAGFRWSPTNGAWQRQLTQAALAEARKIVEGARVSTMFARAPTAEAARSLSVDKLQDFADAIAMKWANAPEIVVVESMQDPRVPEEARNDDAAQRSQGASGQPAGFYYGPDRSVYLVASEIHSAREAITVLAHESLGHFGLRGTFGDEGLLPILKQIVAMRRKEVNAKADAYGLAITPEAVRAQAALKQGKKLTTEQVQAIVRDNLLQAAEEVLAEMAQDTPTLGYVRRAIAAIRTFLRDTLGLDLELTDDEITRNFIIPARGWVVRGREAAVKQPAADPAANALAIAFSRGAASNTLGTRPLRQQAMQTLHDTFSAPGKLSWWHKTVGTQYNLAQRSPQFKRVFDSVQDFLHDVSRYATEAADMAPKILPKLETWRDITKSPISAEDNKAVSTPVFEGTLIWTRLAGEPVKVDELRERSLTMTDEQKQRDLLRAGLSENVIKMWQGLPLEQYQRTLQTAYENRVLRPGIVWTDEELAGMFKLTPEQIGLYKEFRAAVDNSLTHLAVSDMLRFGGKDVEAVRQEVLDTPDVDAAALILRDHLLELAKSQPDRNEVLIDTAEKMIEKADRARDLMDRGYAPLSRFGHYTVDVVDANGERVYFGMFETAREAARMARKMRGNFPDAQVMRGTVSEEEYKLFAGVSPETVELFGELLGLESQGSDEKSQAFQTYIKVAKANRSAMKRLIERKGIAGFSEDVGRVLAGFVYSNARQTSQNLHMGEMTQAATDVSKGEGELKDQATRLVEYVKNPQEEAQAFRGLLFAQYLGGSVASAFVNMLQPVQVTFPYLSQFGGAVKAGQQMARAIADVRKRATGDDALDAALKKAEEEGIVAPQEVHQLMAQARGRGVLKSGDGTPMGNAAAKASNFLSRLTLAWGKFFSSAEQFNRRVTFIVAYRTAQEQGIADPAAFAEKTINETQFVYNKGNRPEWARGAIGSTVFVFKQYSISYVELLHRLATQGGPGGKKAALLMLGMLFLMGGAGGLPFAEDLDDLIDGAMQRLGYNFSTKLAKKQFFENLLGKELGRFAEHGLSGLPGVPIDVSGRLGLGNLIPGTGLLVQKQDHTRDVTEIAGVGGDFASRVFKGAEKTLQGDLFGGAKDLAPRAAYNAAKAAEMYSTGIYKDDKGKKVIDVDAWEALAKGIGFQPTTVAVEQERTGLQHKLIGQAKLAESQFADRWAKAVADGNQQDLADVREAIRQYNVKNPATPVRINRSQIARRVKDLRMPKAERVLKAAPREIRETVRRELAPA
jgi:hypothetical protein